MIRQTTTLPLAESANDGPVGRGALTGKGLAGFVVLELMLLAAIPVLAVIGYQSLLCSQSGEFVVEPTPADPGWQALVDPTPLSVVVEVVDEKVSGLTLVIPSGSGSTGGAVMLVPGALQFAGRSMSELTPEQARRALESMLRLRIDRMVIGDEAGWAAMIGEGTVEVANPDPVTGPDGGTLLPVGEVELDSSTIPAFLGRPLPDTPAIALEFRREIFWSEALADELLRPGSAGTSVSASTSDTEAVAIYLGQIAAGLHQIEAMPVSISNNIVAPDLDATDELLGELVALPAAAAPGDRLQVRILDRAGTNDLESAARALGANGYEVIQIGNAAAWDELPTQVVTTVAADQDQVAALADLVGADSVESSTDEDAVSTVTVLLADDSFAAVFQE